MIAPLLALVLTMPKGWRHIPAGSVSTTNGIDVLDIAVGPIVGGFATNINVLRHRVMPKPASLQAWATSAAGFLVANPKGAIVSSHAQRECNGTIDGWQIESTGVYSGRDVDLVQAVVLDNDYEYVATYTRPIGTGADQQALDALRTLCPLPTASPSSTP